MNAHVRCETQRAGVCAAPSRVCGKCRKTDAAIDRCKQTVCGPHVKASHYYAAALPAAAGFWVAACNGTEEPFRTRTGRRLLYCWLPPHGPHAYLDCDTDMILTDEEAEAALAMS
jgi:hypothetical protein